jgi:hypothetical protein
VTLAQLKSADPQKSEYSAAALPDIMRGEEMTRDVKQARIFVALPLQTASGIENKDTSAMQLFAHMEFRVRLLLSSDLKPLFQSFCSSALKSGLMLYSKLQVYSLLLGN